MNNNLVQFRLDSIVGNVDDLEDVLKKFYKLLRLKPSIRFELVVSESSIIPVALIMCGKYTIEILGYADKKLPKGISCIESIVFESPYEDFGVFELSKNLKIEIRRNLKFKKPKIIEIKINSNNIDSDREYLVKFCDFYPDSEINTLKFSNIRFKFKISLNKFSHIQIDDILKRDKEYILAGWHRISLACRNVETATKHLLEGGAKLLEAPYKVLPGLKESMVFLPSGLVLQPITQQLWKMVPLMMIKSIIAKFRSHYMQFKVTEVIAQ